MHHVEGPITPRDENNALLLQKVRELCAGLLTTSFVLPPLNNTETSNNEVLKNKNHSREPNEPLQRQRHKIALCVFERSLQRDVAQIRAEFDIEGFRSTQFDQLLNRKSIKAICRRGGLTTLKLKLLLI